MGKKKLLSILLIVALVFSLSSNTSIFGPLIIFTKADPGNVTDSWHNATTLNVTVLQLQARINSYGFEYNQSGTWVDRLNAQIDVNNSAEYRFVVNVSSDQGWDDIEYINITAWYDNGNEASTYNSTLGGNLNLFLQYENTTGTANWTLQWPDDEAYLNRDDCYETIVNDSDGSPGNTECYNITFAFTPGYQLRYAPGDGAPWLDGGGYNDTWSWNFNITVEDQGGFKSYHNPIIGECVDEFGTYIYTEISSVGWPTITGNPGTTAIADSNITVESRSNNNYSLSVDLDQLDHIFNPTANMANTSVSLRGGNLTSITSFPGDGPLFIWGWNDSSYQAAENNNLSHYTTDIEYRITIPLAQLPGDYQGTLRYHLTTES